MKVSSIVSSTVYRISVLTLTILCAFGIFCLALRTRPRLDAVPDIKPITPAKYNEWGQYADVLNAGVYINNFAVADFPQGLFLIDAFVWFQFDPQVFSLDTIKQFSFDRARILEKEFVESIKVEENIFVRYKVRVEFKSNLHFKYFPLDNHRINLVLKFDNLAPSEVILTSYFTRTWFGVNAISFNWAYGEPSSDFGYLEDLLDTRNPNSVTRMSATSVYFDFSRATMREAVLIVWPFVFILFLILGSLLMAITSFQELIISVLGILGMFAYREIVSHMSPATSYYTLNDCIFLLVFGCAMLVIIFEIVNAVSKSEDVERVEMRRGVALMLASLLFLVGWFYLLQIW